ncbi:MAG: hypothetical protein ACREJD_03325 [Phycisphaerales bacterium]
MARVSSALGLFAISALVAWSALGQQPTTDTKKNTRPAAKAPAAKPLAKPAVRPGAQSNGAKKLASDSMAALLKGDDAKEIETKLDEELVRLAEEADPVADVEGFYAIANASRSATLLSHAKDPDVRENLIAAFRKAPKFMNELAMALNEKDDVEKVGAVASKLWKAEGVRLNDYATLGAAICVVHDREVIEQANENKVSSDDPLKLFDYFADNEARMPLGLKNVPVPLLVFVVDTTAKVPELEWALNKYRGDRSVGARFFEIQYDMNHFVNGAPKRVTQEGLTLPNIAKYGGVCIDQAYFAANVGKANGIPSSIMRGKSAEVGHAWVAYLLWNGQTAIFDITKGRYPEYRAVIGYVQDPQTGDGVSEAELALRAALALTPPEKRMRAIALEDAGYALAGKLLPRDEAIGTDASGHPIHEKMTPDKVTRLLAISEAAANLSPGSARAWRLGVAIGVTGSWTPEQRNRWGEAILKTLGKGYASCAVDCLIRVINSVDDIDEQNKMWNWLFASIDHNGDLASIVRFNQATMFEREHMPEKAWECYDWILKLYADSSPMAVGAAQRLLALLKDNGKSLGDGAAILGKAWANTTKPRSLNPAFASQSNWYRIGKLYRIALKDAGQTDDYTRVSATLGLKP